MAVYRTPGSIEDHLDKALHRLSDTELAAAGLLRNTLAKQSNPNQRQRLSLEDAVKLDALLLTKGGAPVFLALAKLMADQLLGALRSQAGDLPVQARLHRIYIEVGDLTRAVDAGLQDGRLDLAERRQIAREAQEVIDHAVALRDAVEPPAGGLVTISRAG